MTTPHSSRQRGIVLITALIFLIVLTIIVVSAATTSRFGFKITANAQWRVEAIAAAQQVIDMKMADMSYFSTTSTASSGNVDIDGDGDIDYVVDLLKPKCLSMGPDPSYSYAANPPQIGLWEVVATARNTATGTTATVTQGVRMTAPVGALCTN